MTLIIYKKGVDQMPKPIRKKGGHPIILLYLHEDGGQASEK